MIVISRCKSSSPALLSELIRCATCDCFIKSSSSRKNRNTKYFYYTCYNHAKYKTCRAIYKNVPAELLERSVVEEILRILKSPEIVIKINKLAEKQSDVDKADFLQTVKNLNKSWEYLHTEEKRKILKMLIKNVEIMDDGIKINLNLEDFDGFLVEPAA
jgi:hypothetical protein